MATPDSGTVSFSVDVVAFGFLVASGIRIHQKTLAPGLSILELSLLKAAGVVTLTQAWKLRRRGCNGNMRRAIGHLLDLALGGETEDKTDDARVIHQVHQPGVGD